MKITIVYGGRGLIEDPTLYVIEKVHEVLDELRVKTERINLYEERNVISTMPASLKDSDAIILACSLEWFGMGGYMQEFLDACWLYGDKDKINTMYMMPVVLSTTTGEKDVLVSLEKAWEVLGGKVADGICAYVDDPVNFEMNRDYAKMIEKKTEGLYRTVNQKVATFPSSSTVIRNKVQKAKSLELTPQESEQLSKFVSDDAYVKRQKEDIEELAAMFKGMLDSGEDIETDISSDAMDLSDNYTPAKRETKKKSRRIEQDSVMEEVASKKSVEVKEVVNEELPDTKPKSRQTSNRQKVKAQMIPKSFKDRFMKNYHPEAGFSAVYIITVTDKDQSMRIAVTPSECSVSATTEEKGDVVMRVSTAVLNRITIGEMTFQRAFMSGDMKVKGDFKTLRTMDQLFKFS
ncbi:MAG: SCP2 sterol-binding domain-containing protein [Lachnospiraceae bacterium]|nr:SCP2 sterol-binding domain-containing protein [Lachnospiraceae bacterium]